MLPITSFKKEIVNAVKNHAFTIVTAETGSGKSTQIPQYLAECFDEVVVTEPRVMAAKTLAYRVAEEMNETIGEKVGYRTAYDKCSSSDSKILFCTDGLQLIRTIFDKESQKNRVLVIDEAHEWNLNIETLIAWCKFMDGKWNTKIVVMSATIDTESLADFFGSDVKMISVPGTLYDVEVEERSSYDLTPSIAGSVNMGKNVLVFVPGKKEISNVINELTKMELNATILPLHGELDWEDQKKCFETYSNPKVIVATNVAQTSITIPDIDVVVDTGEARVSVANNGIQGLFLKKISKADVIQRKGRAGRTKNGKYILCSDTSIKYLSEFTVPEIQRSILDRVVLQIATIGLDAEELKFFHQPNNEAILEAKRQLKAIGALSDNTVTELGHKIVKIPVSVQFARMIVEAEKYGVTEQVLTIAAIVEMGGLLAKEGSYFDFTVEKNSDLLAELDVWNYLNQLGYIEFDKLKINKKSFFKIKEHIKKLKEVLFGIVELKNNDDREAVLKSCLSGMVSHIYTNGYNGWYEGNDGITARLSKNTCILRGNFVVGIPKEIEFSTRYGIKQSMNIITFASKIDGATLCELIPDSIKTETLVRYSSSQDAVEVTVNKYFLGEEIYYDVRYDKEHPEYERLKKEYEDSVKTYQFTSDERKQKVVVIDGKQFEVYYHSYPRRAIIYIDSETLFTTDINNVFLDSGEKVWIGFRNFYCKEMDNIVALRNSVEMQRVIRIRENKEREYESLKVNTIDDVLKNESKLGKVILTMDKGGYGDTPILSYGSIALRKNTVSFKLVDDEELANSNTLEALQYLFIKEVEKKYGENKFSHLPGKKKKVLTDSEREVKKDFDSLVREVLLNLTVENTAENLEFLEEYYQDVLK